MVFPEMMRVLYSQPYSIPCDDASGTTVAHDHGGLMVDTDQFEGFHSSHLAVPAAYTWGSRGPALDGSLGLCVAAPGAANTSVASWQLRPAALLNGSSMSAPLVTGCVVPHLSLLDQGHGVIQVDKAFRYLLAAIGDGCSSKVPSNPLTTARDPSTGLTKSDIQSESTMLSRQSYNASVEPQNPVRISYLSSPIVFGWRVRCTVTGPGCVYRDRGIWIRRGWIPRLSTNTVQSSRHRLPVLRYTIHISIDFDKSVPLESRRLLEIHLNTSVYNHITNPVIWSSDALHEKPAWLQVASMISVTSLGRDISLVIDPNYFVRSSVTSSTGTERGKPSPLEVLGTQPTLGRKWGASHECNGSSTSSFYWPSSLSLQSTAPVSSTEPQITLVNFTDSSRPELGPLTQIPIIVHIPTA
ncbi:unnamed protein product [Echinostoma caproni]|uniref:Peptidase S8/S53 domain-containing protein n=1 Tax=Echinostoma caproni TaxID=27848 RepID=A0A3P8H260_9TREM|nr:unnamed protein product [Echinostoma caproni]